MKSRATAQYVCRSEQGCLALELSFIGSNEVGQENPGASHVRVQAYEKMTTEFPYMPWLEKWSLSLGNLPTPDDPWNDCALTAIVKNRFFVAAGNGIRELDVATGTTKWSVETGNTAVAVILPRKRNPGVIVYNSYFEFNDPHRFGNVACVSLNGRLLWQAELPSADDVYANPPQYLRNTLFTQS